MKATHDGERHYDLAPDGAGGAMVAWQWALSAEPVPMNAIWLQRVSADGTLLWSGQGAVAQIDRGFLGLGTPRLLPLGTADVMVVWEDNRRWYKVDEYDIYAQRVVEGTYRRYLPMIAH